MTDEWLYLARSKIDLVFLDILFLLLELRQLKNDVASISESDSWFKCNGAYMWKMPPWLIDEKGDELTD